MSDITQQYKKHVTLSDIVLILIFDALLLAVYFKAFFMLSGVEPRKLLVIIGGLCVAPVIVVMPRISMAILIIFCSFAQANIHIGETFLLSFVDIFTMTLLIVLFFDFLFDTVNFVAPPKSISLLTFFLFIIIGIVAIYHFTHEKNPALLALFLKNRIIQLLLFLIFATLTYPEKTHKIFIAAFLIGIIISCLWALSGIEDIDLWSALRGESSERISNYAFFHANVLGQYLVLGLPFAFFTVLYSRSTNLRMLGLFAGLLGGVSLLLTFSRSCWIASLIGIAFVSLRHRKGYARLFLALIGFTIILEIFAQAAFKISLYELLSGRFEELGESGFSMRPYIWSVSLRIILQHPFTGVGPGFFPEAYWMDMEVTYLRQNAHNTFLNLAAEWGLIFCISFIIWYGTILLRGYKGLTKSDTSHREILMSSLTCGLITITLVMIFEHVFNSPLVATLFFIMCGLIVGLTKKDKHDEDSILRA